MHAQPSSSCDQAAHVLICITCVAKVATLELISSAARPASSSSLMLLHATCASRCSWFTCHSIPVFAALQTKAELTTLTNYLADSGTLAARSRRQQRGSPWQRPVNAELEVRAEQVAMQRRRSTAALAMGFSVASFS